MMREITDYDRKMSEKLDEWMYFDGDSFRLKENAPQDVKKYYEYLGTIYNDKM